MAGNVRPNGAAGGTPPSTRSSLDDAMVARLIEEARIELKNEKELKTKKVSPKNYEVNKTSISQAIGKIVEEKPTSEYWGIKYNSKGNYESRIKSHLTELQKNLSENFTLTEEHKKEQDKLILQLGEQIFNKVMTDTKDSKKAVGQCGVLYDEIQLCLRTTSAKKKLKAKMDAVFLKVKISDLELQVGLSEAQANVELEKAVAEAKFMLSKIDAKLKIFDKIDSLTSRDEEEADLNSQIEALINEVKTEVALQKIGDVIKTINQTHKLEDLNKVMKDLNSK